MHSLARHFSGTTHGVSGFEAVQEFEHESGLVEGIGYRNGELVRYTAGCPDGSAFECEPITVAAALRWWAELQTEEDLDSAAWTRNARARFLETAAEAAGH